MASKFIIFVIFAVLAQSSFGSDQNDLKTVLPLMKSGARDTLAGIITTFDGFYEALHELAQYYSKNQNINEEITSKLKAIEKGQIPVFTGGFDIWIKGLEPIAGNVSVIAAGVDGAHQALTDMIEHFYTSFEKIQAQDHSTYPAAIQEAKQDGISKINVAVAGVFSLIQGAVNSVDPILNSAIVSVSPSVTEFVDIALGSIYDGLGISMIEVPRASATPIESCLTAIHTRREVSIAAMTGEGQMKMSLFQSIKIASFLKNPVLMADVTALANAEAGVWNGLKSAFDQLFAVLSDLEECDDASSIIESLPDQLSEGLSAVLINTLNAISYMKPAGSAVSSIDFSGADEKLIEITEGIVEAIKLTQTEDANEVHAKIPTIEEKVAHAAIHIFGDFSRAMEDIASDISDDLVDEIIKSWKHASSTIKHAIHGIFRGIGILVRKDTDTDGIQSHCETNAQAIETARNAVMFNLIKEVTTKFRLIRASHLYAALQDNGTTISLSMLLA